jgi:GT2 family glycosyltransferase
MVSIIILSYNTEKLLHECLKSLFSTLSTPFEVIVFDNASSDASVSMVKREFPKVQLIQSGQNLGFAKGINTASKKAKGRELLFLNSDATLLDDHLKDMVSAMEDDSSVAVIGGNLLQRDNATSDAFGSFYNLSEVVRLLFFPEEITSTSCGFT